MAIEAARAAVLLPPTDEICDESNDTQLLIRDEPTSTSLPLGMVPLGDSITKSVRIYNGTLVPQKITITPSDPDFRVYPSTIDLAGHEEFSLDVTFTANSLGKSADSFRVTANGVTHTILARSYVHPARARTRALQDRSNDARTSNSKLSSKQASSKKAPKAPAKHNVSPSVTAHSTKPKPKLQLSLPAHRVPSRTLSLKAKPQPVTARSSTSGCLSARGSGSLTARSSASAASRRTTASTTTLLGPSKDFESETWMDRQEHVLSSWLRYMIDSDQESHLFGPNDTKGPAGDGTGKTRASTRRTVRVSHSLLRRAGLLRRGIALYRSNPVAQPLKKIAKALQSGRVVVHTDTPVTADVSTRDTLLQLFSSYNLTWLAYGLMVVLRLDASVVQMADMRDLVEEMVLQRDAAEALCSRALQSESEHDFQPHNAGVLTTIVSLILFLDHAHRAALLSSPACLFVKEGSIRDSRRMLQSVTMPFLKGAGDVCRQFSYFGYEVTVAQSLLDEYERKFASLSTALRDGVRLCMLAANLAQKREILKAVTLPATSLPERLKNLNLALKHISVFAGLSSSPSMNARNIAMGNRSTTLAILWWVMAVVQLPALVNLPEVRGETARLTLATRRQRKHQHTQRSGRSLPAPQLPEIEAAQALPEADAVMYCGVGMEVEGEAGDGGQVPPAASESLTALLEWCVAALDAAEYMGPVKGTRPPSAVTSFSAEGFRSGVVPCLLVRTYAAWAIEMDKVAWPPSVAERVQHMADEAIWTEAGGAGRGQLSFITSEASESPETVTKRNLKILNNALLALGDIPPMLRVNDAKGLNEDRSVILLVAFLASRLIHYRRLTIAARTIQKAYIGHTLRRRETSARAIQRWFRHHACALRLSQVSLGSITLVQAWWRMLLSQRAYVRLQKAALAAQ
eukprot:Rmarinus@m.26124